MTKVAPPKHSIEHLRLPTSISAPPWPKSFSATFLRTLDSNLGLCFRVSNSLFRRKSHSDHGSSTTSGYGDHRQCLDRVADISQSNGGEVLPIEKHANVKIVDHARKEAPPGTYVHHHHSDTLVVLIAARSHSYRYIEKSVRNGVLEDLEDHRVGPDEGTVRSAGSTIQPPKGTRNKYTQDDDRILWNWVHEKPQKGGGTDGNEIYKQLEAKVRWSMGFTQEVIC